MKKNVKAILMPGIWVDAQDGLHINAEEFLASQGYRPTPANVRTLIAAARDLMREKYPEIIFEEIDERIARDDLRDA